MFGMDVPDLLPPAELLCDGPSAEYLELLTAQVGHLERKSNGLLSGRVVTFGREGFIRYQFRARIPKVPGYEAVLFTLDRDPSRSSGKQDLDDVETAFRGADVVSALRNLYSVALSVPDHEDPFEKYEAEG